MTVSIPVGTPNRKNQYQRLIAEYVKRRESLRKRYGIINVTQGTCPEYRKKVKHLNEKIGRWRKTLKKIENNEKLCKDIYGVISEFLDIKFRNISHKERSAKLNLARSFYFKKGIESGITGTFLIMFLGLRNKSSAYVNRRNFNKKLQKSPEIMQKWQQFKQYYREELGN